MAGTTGRCPSPEELQGLVGEALGDADRTVVEAHVEGCAACQERLERLVAPTEPLARPSTTRPAGSPPTGAGLDDAFLERLRQLPVPPPTPGPSVREVTDERVPTHLGPYMILGRLGRGGMGTVYRARHRELDRVVALKVLPADRVDEADVARFRNEMKAAGRLGHPNIVTAHDAGRVGGTYYLAMDFVDGADLSALVGRFGPLPIADACELVRQAAVGLQHACECGLAHRDVKPSNLMLARGGVVKVLDLGLARSTAERPASERLTVTGVMLGTADYLAPEQIDKAHTADARADVYGLGGTLYFLLTGSPPFGDRATWWEKLRAHADAPVPPVRQRRPDVPAALAALLERMLAKDPADRPATPGEVADALGPFAGGSDAAGLLTRAGASAPTPRPAPPDIATTVDGRRRRLRSAALRYALAAGAGALVALLAAAPFLIKGRGPAPSGGAAPNASPAASDEAEQVEGVRLTYGRNGPPRPDHYVLPGELVDMEFVVRGVGKNPKGDVDLSLAGEMVDQRGKKVSELLPTPFKTPPYDGGSTVIGNVSFVLDDKQAPGGYQLRGRLTDNITRRVVSFEHPLIVRRPEFGAVRLRLTHDKEGVWPAGCHLTVGQQFFIQMHITNFAHEGRLKDNEGRIHLSVTLSVRDRDGKDLMPAPVKPLIIDQRVEDAFNDFPLQPVSKALSAGEVTFVVELEDLIGKKKARYELPVVIHPPRSISLRPFTKER
jgi:hypothetical protein